MAQLSKNAPTDQAHGRLQQSEIPTRIASIPRKELYLRQAPAQQRKVLPPPSPVQTTIEAGAERNGECWLYGSGSSEAESAFVGIQSFDASASVLYLCRHFGTDTVAAEDEKSEKPGTKSPRKQEHGRAQGIRRTECSTEKIKRKKNAERAVKNAEIHARQTDLNYMRLRNRQRQNRQRRKSKKLLPRRKSRMCLGVGRTARPP